MNATQCKRKPKKVTEKVVEVETIPQSVLRDFVGNVHKMFKIDCMRVSPHDKYRINVWALKDNENDFVKSFVIAKSFYVHYNKEVGITDETYSHRRQG